MSVRVAGRRQTVELGTIQFPGHDEGLPGNGRAGLRYGKRRMPPVLLVSRPYYAGLRWSRTYSSVPVLPPLLVPEGWQDSYGLDWVGQPV